LKKLLPLHVTFDIPKQYVQSFYFFDWLIDFYYVLNKIKYLKMLNCKKKKKIYIVGITPSGLCLKTPGLEALLDINIWDQYPNES